MALQTFVIEGVPEIRRRLDAERWWAAIEHVVPRALAPLLARLRGAAPHGRTGRLARGGFDISLRRMGSGLIHGLQVAVGARQPYAHLVDRGHRIIPRGPTRKSGSLSRRDRASLRSGLKTRRAAGARGMVPGRHFVEPIVQQLRPQVVGLIEKLMAVEVTR